MQFGDILIYTIAYFGLFTAIFFLLTIYENKKKLKVPKIKEYYKVSIMVPAYNEEKTIKKTIKSLLNLDYPKDKLEILVIDDGSTDNTYQIAKQFECGHLNVLKKKNEGKAATLNFGLKHCSGELVGCLDADSFVTRNALKRIVGYFYDKDIMAVTASLKVHKPKKLLQRIQMIEYLIGIFLRKVFAFLGSIHVTPGPFSIYRKKFFDKHGGYDEDNITEDIEIAFRIQSNQYIIENSETASVYTVSPSSFKELLRQRVRWYVGGLKNAVNYRHLFGTKHGNLGMFILPGSFISVFLVVVSMFYFSYKFISNASRNLVNYYMIKFDLLTLLDLRLDSFYLNISTVMLLSILSLIASVAIICFAKKISKEKTKIKTSYFYYLFFYWILFGFWWFISLVYMLFRKRIDWGRGSINEF